MSDDPLPAIRLSLFGGTQIVPIPIPGEARACNPSIAINGRGFCAIVRVVNYELSDAGVLISLPGGREVSSNWLVEFDRNLNATASSRIDDEAARTGEQAFPGGFEDGRLFRWKSAWWFSATVVVDFAPVRAKIVLCRLAGQRVTECYLMESPLGAAIEKNWMPFVDQDALGWIYRISPTQLMRHRDGEAPRYEQIGESGPLDGWFGSSQCVRYRGRWICVVHRRRHRPESVFYEHRFVELTDDFRIRPRIERMDVREPGSRILRWAVYFRPLCNFELWRTGPARALDANKIAARRAHTSLRSHFAPADESLAEFWALEKRAES